MFMCGMNAVRSPMAEMLARRMLPSDIFISSAGVHAGERDPFVDVVLEEEGLSLGDREPRAVDVEYWPTFDPTSITGTREQRLTAYREVRDHLKERIAKRFTGPDNP